MALHLRPWPRLAVEQTALRGEVAATKLLAPKYPRRAQPDFVDAIRGEAVGIPNQHVFECCQIQKARGTRLNSLRSRYVLPYKAAGTTELCAQARLVVQSMRRLDRDCGSLFNYPPTVVQVSSRLPMSGAASLNLSMATRDIAKANVFTTHPPLRDLYVVPPSEADAGPDELWRLVRPLFGLPEVGSMWYHT